MFLLQSIMLPVATMTCFSINITTVISSNMSRLRFFLKAHGKQKCSIE
ncbi:hypothetical protein IAQ61_000096, partial [Plenodomus lingam]